MFGVFMRTANTYFRSTYFFWELFAEGQKYFFKRPESVPFYHGFYSEKAKHSVMIEFFMRESDVKYVRMLLDECDNE